MPCPALKRQRTGGDWGLSQFVPPIRSNRRLRFTDNGAVPLAYAAELLQRSGPTLRAFIYSLAYAGKRSAGQAR